MPSTWRTILAVPEPALPAGHNGRISAPSKTTSHHHNHMRLALFQPDIAQNTGTMLRLAACLGISVDLIEPCGFVWSEAKLRRAGLDYLDHVDLRRHTSWAAFQRDRDPTRLVLLTTKGDVALPHFKFRADDTVMVGRESAGVPDKVHEAADARVVIPMRPGLRSLNVALAAAIAVAEALRQTGQWPQLVEQPVEQEVEVAP